MNELKKCDYFGDLREMGLDSKIDVSAIYKARYDIDPWEKYYKPKNEQYYINSKSIINNAMNSFAKTVKEELYKDFNKKEQENKEMTDTPKKNLQIPNRNKSIVFIEKFTKDITIPQHKARPLIITCDAVRVKFSNGHVQEAVCMPGDNGNYDMGRAIEVCLLKEALGGSKAYNDFIRKCVKKYETDIKIDKKDAEDKAAKKRKEAKIAERKAKRLAKKKEQERQEQIDIMSQAFLKAMQKYDEQGVNDNLKAFQEEMDRLGYLDDDHNKDSNNTCENDRKN